MQTESRSGFEAVPSPPPFHLYRECSDYSNFEEIFKTFPHLQRVNEKSNFDNQRVTGIIIRSANDDNVHKAIKYGIWTTTCKNRSRLQNLWENRSNSRSAIYLFFSVVKSGMFEGVARLASGYHEEIFPFWWDNHTFKFKGFFSIEWVYIKDVNYRHLAGFRNTDGQDVTKSKDCDMLDENTTLAMLSVFNNRPVKRNIFNDFPFMDERERCYVRQSYQQYRDEQTQKKLHHGEGRSEYRNNYNSWGSRDQRGGAGWDNHYGYKDNRHERNNGYRSSYDHKEGQEPKNHWGSDQRKKNQSAASEVPQSEMLWKGAQGTWGTPEMLALWSSYEGALTQTHSINQVFPEGMYPSSEVYQGTTNMGYSESATGGQAVDSMASKAHLIQEPQSKLIPSLMGAQTIPKSPFPVNFFGGSVMSEGPGGLPLNILRPGLEIKDGSTLGFQMNPVSRNKKK